MIKKLNYDYQCRQCRSGNIRIVLGNLHNMAQSATSRNVKESLMAKIWQKVATSNGDTATSN